MALEYLGRTSEAFEFIDKLEKDFPRQEDVASTYAVLLAPRGDKKTAEEKIRIAIEAGQGKLHFHHAEYNIASAYALMGKGRLALEWLQKTAADGLPCYPLFEKDPHLRGQSRRSQDEPQLRSFLRCSDLGNDLFTNLALWPCFGRWDSRRQEIYNFPTFW